MRVRDPSERPPFSISHSELFEEAVFALQRQFPFIDEGVQNLEWTLRRFDAVAIPAHHVPYSAEEIGRWRRDPLMDVAAERARILRSAD